VGRVSLDVAQRGPRSNARAVHELWRTTPLSTLNARGEAQRETSGTHAGHTQGTLRHLRRDQRLAFASAAHAFGSTSPAHGGSQSWALAGAAWAVSDGTLVCRPRRRILRVESSEAVAPGPHFAKPLWGLIACPMRLRAGPHSHRPMRHERMCHSFMCAHADTRQRTRTLTKGNALLGTRAPRMVPFDSPSSSTPRDTQVPSRKSRAVSMTFRV